MATKMTHLYVHYGMHKTGSSSIQETLKEILPRANFGLVSLGNPNASLPLRRAFSQAWYKDAGPGRKEQREETRRRIKGLVGASEKSAAIVSGEAICQFLGRDLREMRDFFAEITDSFELVGYIREPKSYLESAYQETIKLHRRELDLLSNGVRYRERFRKFDAIFGRSRVKFWSFQKRDLKDACVVTDFVTRLGIPLQPGEVVRANDSLSAAAVQILSRFRDVDQRPRYRPKRFIDLLSELDGPPFRISPKFFFSLCGPEVNADNQNWAYQRAGIEFDSPSGDGFDTLKAIRDVPKESYEWLIQRTGDRIATPQKIIDDPSNLVDLVNRYEARPTIASLA